MRRAVKMRKAGGKKLIQMLENKKKLRGRCNNAGKFSFIRWEPENDGLHEGRVPREVRMPMTR